MRAAVYARKSSDNEAGVARQVDLGRDFIRTRGWTLDATHVYQDNDVSGATFDRPGLNALLAAIAQKPMPFDVLVMMDASRLGRDMEETLPLQGRITRAGVRIFHYQDGQELLLTTPVQKLIASVANFSHEDFRYQIRLKTTQALKKKAEQGHAVAGRIFGYTNHEVTDATGKRTHVELRINDAEAEVVRRVFTWCADGHGIREIAKRLNAEGIPAPRARHTCTVTCKHKPFTGTWMATTITALLNRQIYAGHRRWSNVDESMPALEIVSDDLWTRAQRRRAKTRQQHSGYRRPNGQLAGRQETPTPHLLSGLLECGGCGSSLIASSRVNKDRSVRRYYVCSRTYKQGSGKCKHLVPYAGITDAVLGHFSRLTPHLIEQMIADEYDRWLAEVRALDGQRGALVQERDRLDAELARLAEGVAAGGQLPALLKAIETKQADRDMVAAQLEHAQGSEEAIKAILAQWSSRLPTLSAASIGGLGAVLRAGPSGRRMLRALLPNPVRVTPMYGEDGAWQGWRYDGEAYLGRLAGSLTCHQRTESVRIS
jgi:site-specific DNA recombinase